MVVCRYTEGWALLWRIWPQLRFVAEHVMVTGFSSVPADKIVPLTRISLAVVPEATPSIRIMVFDSIRSVLPTGTVTSLVTWTTPVQTLVPAANVPVSYTHLRAHETPE